MLERHNTSKPIITTAGPSENLAFSGGSASNVRVRGRQSTKSFDPLSRGIDSRSPVSSVTSGSEPPTADAVRVGIPLEPIRRRRAVIANVQIDSLSFAEVVAAIVDHARKREKNEYVVTPNAHHVTLLQNNDGFRRVYEGAFLAVPDGVPLLWAGRILDQDLPERVNGTDLFEAICAPQNSAGLRIFLLGGREGAAEAAASRLLATNPALTICGTYCPPFGFEHDELENAKIVASINDARTDILFVGLGAPKQEFWMAHKSAELHAAISIGIGVSFEFVAGIVPRAPKWMQKAGLEWLFRLCSEPNRLWRRYVVGNAVFGSLIAKEYLAKLLLGSARLEETYAHDRLKTR